MASRDEPRDNQFFLDLLTSAHEAVLRDPSASMIERAAPDPVLQARLARAEAVLRALELDRRQQTEADGTGVSSPPPGMSFDADSGVRRFGRFEVLGELGRGGFGIVLHALDPTLHREVAVKVPRPEVLLAPALKRRLVCEAKAAAGLDHPNIVPLYEAGDHLGIPYLVSAYCPGPNLADWLSGKDKRFTWQQATELLAQVAEAVAAMHERGIWHRDLKPSNILLQPRTTATATELSFVPRVTDFGLAKLTELQTVTTAQGVRLGTLPYMAPEQASGCVETVGPASDVYALGVILYELLAGSPPFKGRTDLETLQQMALREPPPLPRRTLRLPRVLETVCLKCLAREPEQRYHSAAELAADLRRVLAGQPIKARPVPRLSRMLGAVRRYPVTATLSLLCTVALLGLTMATLAWRREHAQQLREKEHLHYVRRISDTQRLLESGDRAGVLKRLNALRPTAGQPDPRGFEWHHLWSLLRRPGIDLEAHRQSVLGMDLRSDGQLLATGGQDGVVALWDTQTWQLRQRWSEQREYVYAVAFHPEGQHLAAGGTGRLALYTIDGRRQPLDFPANSRKINHLAFCANGLRLVGCTDKGLHIWEPAASPQPRLLSSFAAEQCSLLLLEDNRHALVGGADEIKLYDLEEGQARLVLETPGHAAVTLRVVEGNKLVSIGQDRQALIHDLKTGACLERIGLHLPKEMETARSISCGALSQDGALVALTTEVQPTGDGLVTVQSLGSRVLGSQQLSPGSAFTTQPTKTTPFVAREIHFFPGTHDLVYAGGHGLLGVWPEKPAPNPRILSADPEEAWGVAFTPTGQRLLIGRDNAKNPACLRCVDLRTGNPVWENKDPTKLVSAVAVSPDGSLFASASYDAMVRLHDPVTGEVLRTLQVGEGPLRCVAFSPDGRLIAAGGRSRVALIYEVATGQLVQRLTDFAGTVNGLAFLDQGRVLATISGDGILRQWEVRTGQVLKHQPISSEGCGIGVSKGGENLAVGTREGRICVEERLRGRQRMIEHGHRDEVFSLVFTPDGTRLATSGRDGLIRLWDVSTGYELLTLRGHEKTIHSLCFSPDGHTLASASLDGTVRLWLAGE